MASNQNVNKVVYGNTTLIDLTGDDVTAASVLSGKKFHLPSGAAATGTIATKTSSNLTASGKTVTVPAGYYASQYTKDVATGSATAPSSISGSSATVSTGTNTLTLSKTVSVTPSVSAGYVSSGTAGNSSVSLTASVTTKAAATYNTSASDQTIGSGQYLTGAQTIKAVKVTNLTAENIKSGVTVQVGDADSAGRIASVEGSCKAVDDITSRFTFAKTYRINYVTGARQSGDSTESASSVVNIEGYKYLIISRRCIQDYIGPSGLAFYSGSNRTGYISGLRDIPVTTVNTDVSAVTRIAIPTGAKYVCTTWWKDGTEQASSASFICLGET